MMRLPIFAATAAFVFTAALAQEGEPPRKTGDEGAWRAAGSEPDGEGGLCSRVWVCASGEAILFYEDEKIERTPMTRTRGKCLDDACKICRAPEPAAACRWTVIEKAGGQ